jgi:hypothetical protein
MRAGGDEPLRRPARISSMETWHDIAPAPVTPAMAWRRYLEVTRDVDGDRYREVEPEAWAQLLAVLDQVARAPAGRA